MTAELLTPGDYKVLDPAQQEVLCQEILAEIKSNQFKPAGERSRQHWQEVWRQSSPGPPSFLKPAQVLRVNGQFVRPSDTLLEHSWYWRYRFRLLMDYFKGMAAIYEFGCGNAWNLVAARDIFPNKTLVGLDWAASAVNRMPPGIHGHQFDFFKPDYTLRLLRDAGVWTVGALEQTGTEWEPFMQYLLAQKPGICVHVEPIVEWYDPSNPVDATAIQYHLARHYWRGFPARLRELAAQGKAEILEQKRSYFGSKYIEGYSLFVWRPV